MSKCDNRMEKSSSVILTSAVAKTKTCLYSEEALVFLLIIVLWSLVSLPIIVYHLPKSEITSNTSGSANDTGSKCSAPDQYATISGICSTELVNILRSSNCLPDQEGYLLVMRNDEITVTQLINGFTTLGASAECLHKALPFLCLHLFGLCSSTGLSIHPTSGECEEIRDTTCKQQWKFVETLDIGLPKCEIFPDESLSCLNCSLSTNGPVTTKLLDLVEEHLNDTTASILECTGGFYQQNGSSYCTRSCYIWTQLLQKGIRKFINLLLVLLISSSVLACGAVIIISFLAHKRMHIFPAIFVVYMTIDSLILYVCVIIGFIDRGKLFCASRSLIQSLTEVTTFCVIFGILTIYFISQLQLWWLFHIMTLFWKVIFPYHARAFETSGKNKYIHIMCIIVGILLPLVPIIGIMADTAVDLKKQNANSTSQIRNSLFLSEGLGFGYTRFPPALCTTKNSSTYFYSFLLVKDVILGCGCTLLIFILRSIHKVYAKRKQMQKKVNLNINGKQGLQFTFGTAEKKLIILLSYYVFLEGFSLTFYAIESKTSSDYFKNLQRFLFCEQGIQTSSNQCIHSGNDSIGFTILGFLAGILLSLFPFVNLLYAVNIQELKKLWRRSPLSTVS